MGRSGKTYRRRHRQNRSSSSCCHEEWIINLLKWMKRINFKTSLCPAIFDDGSQIICIAGTGRGLQTKHRINPGDTIISLPESLLVTTQTVLVSDIGYYVKRWSPKLSPQQCISVFLIWENHKRETSPWKPYLDSLPNTFTTPAYFSSKEITFLPKSLRIKAQAECDKLRQKFCELQLHARYHWESFYNILDWDIFRWAWYSINSRSVYFLRNKSPYLSQDEEDNIALAPFLDLLNHSPNAEISAGFDIKTNCYNIITYNTYKPYDQVFISYGCHGNRNLLLEYGFCVPDNYQDEIHLELDDILTACHQFECTLIEEKLDLLRANNMLRSLSCCSDGLTWNLWVVLKTLAMKHRHLKVWHEIYTDNGADEEIVATAKSMARIILNGYLKENLSTIQAIDKNVTANENKDHIHLCQRLLKEERKILQTSLDNLDHNFFK